MATVTVRGTSPIYRVLEVLRCFAFHISSHFQREGMWVLPPTDVSVTLFVLQVSSILSGDTMVPNTRLERKPGLSFPTVLSVL